MSQRRCFGPKEDSPEAPRLDEPWPRTALRIEAEGPRHLEAHMNRLRQGASCLGWEPSWLASSVQDLSLWIGAQAPQGEQALRLLLEPQRLVATLEPLPRAPSPCRLVPLAHPMEARRWDPASRHKGLCGPWSRAVLATASALGGDDALLTWSDGTLAETAIAALALEVGGVLCLPPPEGRVASLAEALDLPRWAAARGLELCWQPIPVGRVPVGRLWCMNTLRGIWPATLL
jgi:branched-subunit amino acid aminotransferase/4-amino-4-deoxychorismate lyase